MLNIFDFSVGIENRCAMFVRVIFGCMSCCVTRSLVATQHLTERSIK